MEHLTEPVNHAANGALVTQERHASPVGHYPEIVNSFAPASEPDEEHSGLLQYWLILRRSKGTVFIMVVIGGLLGILATIPQTPIYQAHTSIEIENLNENFLNIKEVNPTQNGTSGSDISDILTQIKILQSESLNESVVAKLKAAPLPKMTQDRLAFWKKLFKLPQAEPEAAYRQSVNAAAGSLKVRAAGLTRIIEVTVDSTDPNTAANFANTLTNDYIEQHLETRWKTTEKTTAWLSRQLDGMRVKLEQSDDRLQQYARQANLIFTDEKTNVSSAKLSQIQSALSTAQTDRIGKQSRYEMANSSPPEALPDVLNDSGLRDYQTKLTDLRRQIADLTAAYTSEYPKVKRAEAQHAILEEAFKRERGAILVRIKNEYEEALRREHLMAADYATQAKLVSGEGERAIQYNILKREVDSNRQLYDTLLQQLKQANIASALRASNIRVVDPAKVPRSPYKPNAAQNAMIGLLGGLFLGMAFVITRDRADHSMRDPGDVQECLRIPELGVIPNSLINAQGLAGTANGEERIELAMWQQKGSALAESFRSTLVSIFFSAQSGSPPRVFLITSPAPGEGKSTMVSNLAVAVAEVGKRVLLIDGDLRKPRIHSIFGQVASPGLTELLRDQGAVETSSLLASAIKETDVPGLFILPAGKSTSGATSLLYGPRMGVILKALRQQFDTIIIDSPPMLQIPDARVLARISDRVILVVRAGKTTREAAIASLKKFKEDGTQVLGTILNDWNPKFSKYGSYGYYSKYYRDYAKHYHAESKN